MINSFDTNKKRLSYGAVKDVVPQNINAKLPQNVQNYDPKEQVENSMVGSVSNGIFDTKGLKPWQVALSIVGALGVVFGGSALVRRYVRNNGIFKAGEKLDDIYNNLKDKKIGQITSKVKNFFQKNIGDKIKNSSFGELFKKDASGIRPNMMRPESAMAQMPVRGSKAEACDEITDVFEQMLKPKESKFKFINTIRSKILSFGEKIGYVKKGGIRFSGEEGLRDFIKQAGHEDKADELVNLLTEYSNNTGDFDLKFKVKDEFMEVLKDYFKINGKEGKISEIMANAQNTGFTQRIQNGLTHEVDMLSAVKNMMILDGQGAKTPLGRGFQKFLLKAAEAPTNGIMSRSKVGLLMAIGIYMGIINKVQKAPKGEKVSTAGDEATSDIGGYMMLPVNGTILYGLASLKNLGVGTDNLKAYRSQLKNLNKQFAESASGIEKQAIIDQFKTLKKETFKNGSWWQKIIRIPGKIMSMGLEKGPGESKIKGKLGGALRFAAFLFVISPLMIKPIKKLSSKIFGKTSEMKKEEEEHVLKKAQKKQLKELRKMQKNNPQPTIPMSEEELIQKLMDNPEVVQKLQEDPALLEQVSNNPQMLMQMFEENTNHKTQNQTTQAQAPNGNYMSPALKQRIEAAKTQSAGNSETNVQKATNSNPFVNQNVANNAPLNNNIQLDNNSLQRQELEKKKEKIETPSEPIRTYIPSPTPVQISNENLNLRPEQKASIERALANAEEAERSAMRLLS